MNKHLALLVALMAGNAGITVAADPLSTDRPDFVESSLAVGAGVFQIETSVAMERSDGFGKRPRQLSTPTLLRFGISELWELRLETDGLQQSRSEPSSPSAEGFADLSIGAKLHLPFDGPGEASQALLFHLDLPTGSREYRADGDRPSLRYVAEWELPLDCSLGVMPGIALNEDSAGRDYVSGIAGITLGHGWTPSLRSFVELASEELGAGRHGDTQLTFDTGLVWLVNDNLQLDTAAYAGLNRNTPDITIAIGLSARW